MIDMDFAVITHQMPVSGKTGEICSLQAVATLDHLYPRCQSNLMISQKVEKCPVSGGLVKRSLRVTGDEGRHRVWTFYEAVGLGSEGGYVIRFRYSLPDLPG